ncbi:hypothetical protein BJ170DRAFT_727084 [Xylariales sp. AK1849]|nr:hypothetical protein BJ170DRAFT_727084 [Xylariales sp. AK1849]
MLTRIAKANCITDMMGEAGAFGCDGNDIACLCRSQNFVNDIQNCAPKLCTSPSDTEETVDYLSSWCAAGASACPSQLLSVTISTSTATAASGTISTTTYQLEIHQFQTARRALRNVFTKSPSRRTVGRGKIRYRSGSAASVIVIGIIVYALWRCGYRVTRNAQASDAVVHGDRTTPEADTNKSELETVANRPELASILLTLKGENTGLPVIVIMGFLGFDLKSTGLLSRHDGAKKASLADQSRNLTDES